MSLFLGQNDSEDAKVDIPQDIFFQLKGTKANVFLTVFAKFRRHGFFTYSNGCVVSF